MNRRAIDVKIRAATKTDATVMTVVWSAAVGIGVGSFVGTENGLNDGIEVWALDAMDG